MIHPFVIHKLLEKNYDSVKPDNYPVDLTINLFVSNFKSIAYHNQADIQVFEARAQMILKWRDSRINNIEKIFDYIENFNLKMRPMHKVRIFNPVYPHTKTISFYYDPSETPSLWIPFVFSANILTLTAVPGISSSGFIRVNLNSTTGVTYMVNVIIEFECQTNPTLHPFDILKCDLNIDSSEAINLKWGKVEIQSLNDESNKFIITQKSIMLFSKDTLLPCSNQKLELSSSKSCLQISFNIIRNIINFDLTFFIPIVTLMVIAYSTLYFSLSAYMIRIIINTFVMISLINLYLVHPLFVCNTPLLATTSITFSEYLLFSAIFYNLFTLSSTIVQVGFRSYQAGLKQKISKESDESNEIMIKEKSEKEVKSGSPLNAFIEWFMIKTFFLFIYGQENTLLDLFSRGIGLLGIITITLYFRMAWIQNNQNPESTYWSPAPFESS